MRVLVTGAGGFLGRHIVAALRRDGHVVRALQLPNSDVSGLGWDESVDIVYADLLESPNLADALCGVDAVIHLAMKMIGDDEELIRHAVEGSRRLLDAMKTSSCRRIVLASSFSVYDWSRIRRTVHENSPLLDEYSARQADGYARAKLQQELLVRQKCEEHGFQLTVLRPASIWGSGRMPMAVMGQMAGPFALLFAPCAAMKFTYVENCADLFVQALERPETIGATINVADSDRITVWRVYQEHRRRSGGGFPLPVPYWIGKLTAWLASAINRYLLRDKLTLPGILHPRRFEARFKPVSCDNDRMHRLLKWNALYVFDRALTRAYLQGASRRL